MKCAYHVDREAVATCNVCGKGLCQECASYINPPECLGCYAAELEAEKNGIKKSVIIASVVAIVIFILSLSEGGTVGQGILFACVPFGWIALNKITPQIFLFMPIIGWIFYFVLKLIVAMLVGIVALPYKIIKSVIQIKEIDNKLEQVRSITISE